MPIRSEEPGRRARFNFPHPTEIATPRVAVLEPPNVFTEESTCLIDRISKLGVGYPSRCVFAKKQCVETGPNGWKCRYNGAFRSFVLPLIHAKAESRPHIPPRAEKANPDQLDPDSNVSDINDELSSNHSIGSDTPNDEFPQRPTNSDEDRADDLMFWFSDEEETEPKNPRRDPTGGSVPITSRPRLLSDQHDLIFNRLSSIIDQAKYALIVNTLGAIVTARWKPTEMSPGNWENPLRISAISIQQTRRSFRLVVAVP